MFRFISGCTYQVKISKVGFASDRLRIHLRKTVSWIQVECLSYGQVRKAAQDAVGGFMKHLGYEAMRKATDKLSAVSKTTLMPLLGKWPVPYNYKLY